MIDRAAGRRDPLAKRLRNWTGSWLGRLTANVAGEPRLDFSACVHDLGDCAVGVLDLPGSEGGPLHFVLAVPAARRRLIRPELAFEFVSFMLFLEGATPRNPDLPLYEYIDAVLKAPLSTDVVFSVESRAHIPEMQLLLSQQAERLAAAILAGLEGRARRLAAAAD